MSYFGLVSSPTNQINFVRDDDKNENYFELTHLNLLDILENFNNARMLCSM